MVILDLPARVIIRGKIVVYRQTGGANNRLGAQIAEKRVAVAAQANLPILALRHIHSNAHREAFMVVHDGRQVPCPAE
jgi:hypothetical protein